MKNRSLYSAVLIAAVMGLFLVVTKKSSTKGDTQGNKEGMYTAQEQTEQIRVDNPRGKIKTSPDALSQITKEELNSLKKSYPQKEDIIREIKSNPHETPPSLLSFAKKMTPLMEKALSRREDAQVLAKELNSCAMDESVIQTARASCVTNLERLATRHLNLADQAQELRSTVSPDVQVILDNKDLILKNNTIRK